MILKHLLLSMIFCNFFPFFLVTLIKGTCLLRVELTDFRKMSKLILGSLQQKASSWFQSFFFRFLLKLSLSKSFEVFDIYFICIYIYVYVYIKSIYIYYIIHYIIYYIYHIVLIILYYMIYNTLYHIKCKNSLSLTTLLV